MVISITQCKYKKCTQLGNLICTDTPRQASYYFSPHTEEEPTHTDLLSWLRLSTDPGEIQIHVLRVYLNCVFTRRNRATDAAVKEVGRKTLIYRSWLIIARIDPNYDSRNQYPTWRRSLVSVTCHRGVNGGPSFLFSNNPHKQQLKRNAVALGDWLE